MNLKSCGKKHLGKGASHEKMRPVFILKPFGEGIYEKLINEYPDTFEVPVPHTTRPKRHDESDGKPYYFIDSVSDFYEQYDNGEFLEAGMFQNHGYGTRLDAVTDIMTKGKRPLLPLQAKTIEKLRASGLDPLVLCIKMIDPDVYKLFKDLAGGLAESDAKKVAKTENEIAAPFISDTVEEKTVTDAYEKVKERIFAKP